MKCISAKIIYFEATNLLEYGYAVILGFHIKNPVSSQTISHNVPYNLSCTMLIYCIFWYKNKVVEARYKKNYVPSPRAISNLSNLRANRPKFIKISATKKKHEEEMLSC